MTPDHIAILVGDPEEPAARSCLAAYFALLAERIPGITTAHVPDPDPEAASFRAPNGTFLLAWADGQPLACVSLKRHGGTSGEVKRLWVDPAARGVGLARRMMIRVEAEARLLGFSRLVLDTNAALAEAISLYRATGWQDIPAYSGFPATHWFAKPL
jgi:GNAT superfamily N-acetyltransferase